MQAIPNKDKKRLRELAKQLLDVANSESMAETVRLWKTHNACRGERPMIRIELDTFADEIIPPLQECEGAEARELEWKLLSLYINPMLFGDDSIVRNFFPVQTSVFFKAFDLDIRVEYANHGIGHHFVSIVSDLETEFEKIRPSVFGIDKRATKAKVDFTNDIIGDILPVKMTGTTLCATLTQDIVHIMNMENMCLALAAEPELFEKMIGNLADDYIAFFNYLSREGILLPTVENELLGQGSYSYTDDLPDSVPPDSVLKPTDVWGYSDSQETVGVSEAMYRELVFPAYKKVAQSFGLLSYGCCEPVHRIWDSCLSTLSNLRKISISPWCDEAFMGERLRGTKIIYHRKPAATYLGVGINLDEDAVRTYIRKTMEYAKGCTIEFTQRDVYTVNRDVSKVKRYVDIIRSVTE